MSLCILRCKPRKGSFLFSHSRIPGGPCSLAAPVSSPFIAPQRHRGGQPPFYPFSLFFSGWWPEKWLHQSLAGLSHSARAVCNAPTTRQDYRSLSPISTGQRRLRFQQSIEPRSTSTTRLGPNGRQALLRHPCFSPKCAFPSDFLASFVGPFFSLRLSRPRFCRELVVSGMNCARGHSEPLANAGNASERRLRSSFSAF